MKNNSLNYITEINEFYDWLETNQLPKSAIALWHALMHINNKARWQGRFAVAISTIESKTGFKRSELFEGRNILQQKGRINWIQRGGNLSAEYEIIPFCVHNTDTKAYANGYTNPTQKHTQTGTINKLNKTETKRSKSHSGCSPPVRKKNGPEEKVEYWKALVKIWFDFYGEKFKNEDKTPAAPIFNGTQGEHLSKIIGYLKKLAIDKNYKWDEAYSCKCLKGFLSKAFMHDEWIRKNFELGNLLAKFNSITNSNQGGRTESNGKFNNQGSRSDSVRSGQDTAADLLNQQLAELEQG